MSETTRTPVTHGHVPETPDLQEGDFGLNGDLRATMLAALEQSWDPNGPAEQDAEPSAPTSPTGEDAGAGGEAEGEDAAPDLAAPPAPAATPDDADAGAEGADAWSLDQYAREYFGTNLTRDQARELFGVIGGLQALTPEQRVMLDQTIARGEFHYPATTGDPTPPAPAYAPPPPAQPAPSSPPPPPFSLPPRPDDEYEASIYDKYIAPLAHTLDARLSSVQEDIARTTQQQIAQQQAEYTAAVERASAEWRAAHPDITDGEYDALADRIIRSGVFAPLVQSQGSVSAATAAALDQFFWADPNLRARAIANVASGRAEGDHTTSTAPSTSATQRQGRAASVAGGGGVTTSPGTPTPPTTPDARKAAMLADLQAQGEWGN